MDPLLFYFVVRYLREAFSGNQQAHEAIAMRVAQLFSTYPDLARAIKSGEKDVMREWFDDSHNMREFSHKAEDYIELIYDKLES